METTPHAARKWRKDESGKLVMPAIQADYLDWLVDDDPSKLSEPEWCAVNAVAQDTVRKWRADRRFREAWERRALDIHTGPDRMNSVLNTLYVAAKRGDTGAAKQYLMHTERFLPPRQVQRDESVSHMTDAELRAELEGIIAAGFGT